MSTARHHAEWLSLVEVSGPFLSLPVLLQVFPNGLEAHEPEQMRLLRLAHEEWEDNQKSLQPETAIHRAWVEFVLQETLGLPDEVLLSGQAILTGLQVTIAEHQETLRPDWVVVNPRDAAEAGKPRLLVQMVPAGQDLEKGLKGSRWAASPATRMMELLHACNVRLGLLTNGEHWMLVNAPKGETTGYISWYATLWQEEPITLRAFRSLLGVDRFFRVDEPQTLEVMLAQSINSQQEVTDQLGYQVRKAVDVLVQSIDRIDQDRNRSLLQGISETRLYEAALTVMMRLVFLFSAEERKLIPPHENELYNTHYAVSTLRSRLREQADQFGEEVLERRQDAWCRLLATFRAVYAGVDHDALFIPAYGGSLFDPDRFPFLEGRREGTDWKLQTADPIPVNNRTVLHLLEALQILQVKVPGGGGVEPRKLSFRALDIEQIGHVYEGLLDHTAVRAAEPILGLVGTKDKEPEISLAALEAQAAKGETALVAFLREQTGRSLAALQKALNPPHPPAPSPTRGEGGQESGSVLAPLARSGRGAGGEGLSPQQFQRLLIACNNDRALLERILPFAKLIRFDTLDYPVVIPAGSVYVTAGVDRRQTGTHYTPRNLTEEIVQYTLEPLVYEGVAEGKPKEEWRLRSPAELLQLKICDMAMGSGAFLVQTCRYLAEKLVEAWQRELENPPHPPTPSPTRGEGEQEIGANSGSVPLALDGRGARGEGADRWEVPESLKQKMLEVAREFRKQPTSSEEILWQALRSRKLDDRKFRRQQPIGSFVVDFFCASERLIVEVDGGIHETQQDLDRQRQELLESLGLRFVRVNSELVETNLPKALEMIRKAFAPHPPSPLLPLGEKGEQEVSRSPDSVPLALDGRGARGEGDKSGNTSQIRILPDGSLSRAEVGEHILPTDPDERLTLARRIVADRCLYGVDKNPLAVEMAKLSLWLITLAKGRPFTFVDHALKCGDSLLGITRPEQIEFLKLNPEKEAVQLRTVSDRWKPFVQRAIAKRQELENFSVSDIADIQKKEQLNREAEAAIAHVRHVGDFLVAEALAQAGKTSDLTDEEIQVLAEVVIEALDEADVEKQNREIAAILAKTERMMNLGNPANQPPRKPFHWLLEFPEVFLQNPPHPPSPLLPRGEKGEQEAVSPLYRFERGVGGEGLGFDAIVGNPPFQGGQKITGAIGTDYRNFLVEYLANSQRGSADLCAYFFLRASQLTSNAGGFGLVATNTIAQGDTREVGLDQLVANGCVIHRAVPSRPWIGAASLEVAHLWLCKQQWQSDYVLDEKVVTGITPFLTPPGKSLGNPYQLIANQDKSYIGSYVLGMGFVLTPEEAQILIDKDPKNKDVLFPYLNGEDLNSRPDQSPSRWVINFKDWALDSEHDDPKKPKGAPYAADYPDCLAIVREKVKPERDKLTNNATAIDRAKRWWQFARATLALYGAIEGCDRFLIRARVSNINSISFAPPGIVASEATVVFVFEDFAAFGILQGSVHTEWLNYHASSMRTDIRYTPSDCFETFPFPTPDPSDLSTQFPTLNTIGETYYTHRQAVMRERQEGLTKTYNRFHDANETASDIQKLRELHIEMDQAVAAAYSWQDLDLGHGFHKTKQGIRYTISETARREVLDRLLELNHQRYAEEVAQGLHDKKKAKGKGQKAKGKKSGAIEPETVQQGELF